MDALLTSVDIVKDDMGAYKNREPAFVTFGEVMIRDIMADMQRPECTRQVHISLAGSEFTLAIVLARFGIPSAYTTRWTNNPYGCSQIQPAVVNTLAPMIVRHSTVKA